jgi:hypothetical protein
MRCRNSDAGGLMLRFSHQDETVLEVFAPSEGHPNRSSKPGT